MSCRFGTFLYNCVKDREDNDLRSKTFSLWTYLQNSQENRKFYNTFYVANPERVLYPRYSAKVVVFWNEHYLRHCTENLVTKEALCKLYFFVFSVCVQPTIFVFL